MYSSNQFIHLEGRLNYYPHFYTGKPRRRVARRRVHTDTVNRNPGGVGFQRPLSQPRHCSASSWHFGLSNTLQNLFNILHLVVLSTLVWVGIALLYISHRTEMRLREVNVLLWNHRAGDWQSQGLDLDLSPRGSCFLLPCPAAKNLLM